MKLPYRVPSMSEIAATPPNGLTHVSTFSGSGGTCLGFRMAGYATIWANECDDHAQQSYRANHPDTVLDPRDVRDVTAADILAAAGLSIGQLDVFEGSPPCTAFSRAGKGAKKWGGIDRHAGAKTVKVEELAFEFVRLLGGLMPRAFVVENVLAWAEGSNAAYFYETRRRMKALGYRLRTRAINAHSFGVPQDRWRLIVAGVRDGLGVEPWFHLTDATWHYSLCDVVPGTSCVAGYEFGQDRLRSADRPMPTVMTSPTLKVCVDGVVRQLTIVELKRVCSFPDDFRLEGSKTEQWRRLGNSVPPLMARAIAIALRDALLGEVVMRDLIEPDAAPVVVSGQ